MKTRSKVISVLGIAVLAGLTGCGGGGIKTDSVEGTITFNGVPVEGASVMFTPVNEEQGSPAYATTDANGRYKLQTLLGAVDAGTTPGEYRVTVSKVEMVGTGKKTITPDGDEVEIEEPKELLPARYKFQQNTPLSATVVEGQANVFDFDLER